MAADQFTEFDYLLNALESAASCEYPAKHGYGEKRKALYRHVRELERKATLWNLIESMWSFPGQTLGELVQRIAKERTAGVKPCPYCDAPPGHWHSFSCPVRAQPAPGGAPSEAPSYPQRWMFPGVPCWEHECPHSTGKVLLPQGRTCTNCGAADGVGGTSK